VAAQVLAESDVPPITNEPYSEIRDRDKRVPRVESRATKTDGQAVIDSVGALSKKIVPSKWGRARTLKKSCSLVSSSASGAEDPGSIYTALFIIHYLVNFCILLVFI
jgi:hypothetical protein